MLSLPPEGSAILQQFRAVFTTRTYSRLEQLLIGALLCTWSRTVCMALRFLGRAGATNFCSFHRFLNRARWSGLAAARCLLRALVDAFCPPQKAIVFAIDETIERRRGPKIKAKGIYRDPVRASHSHFVKCSGLRWMCLMLLAHIPWAARIWALPCFTALAPSKRYFEQHRGRRRPKKIIDWARQMILIVSRWLKGRQLIITADSSYAALELLAAIKGHAAMITRLRMDAALYDSLPPADPLMPAGKGRPRLKGERQPTLAARLEDETTVWTRVIFDRWYDTAHKEMELASAIAVWYHVGMAPVLLRWVLIRDPEGKGEPAALLCTDTELDAASIVRHFTGRWCEEVTLREVRAHLGVETQRQWSDLAIARTTPCLMGLFSIVVLWADQLNKKGLLKPADAAWYHKVVPTFSDALAAVRRQIWQSAFKYMSGPDPQTAIIPIRWVNFLILRLARAA